MFHDPMSGIVSDTIKAHVPAKSFVTQMVLPPDIQNLKVL